MNERNSCRTLLPPPPFSTLLIPPVYFPFHIPLPFSLPPFHLFLNVSLRMSSSRKSEACICPSHLIKVLFVPAETRAPLPVNVFWVARIPVNNLLLCILQIIVPVWCPSCFNHSLERIVWCTACTDCYKVHWGLDARMQAQRKECLCIMQLDLQGQTISTSYFFCSYGHSCCFSFWEFLRIQRLFLLGRNIYDFWPQTQ